MVKVNHFNMEVERKSQLICDELNINYLMNWQLKSITLFREAIVLSHGKIWELFPSSKTPPPPLHGKFVMTFNHYIPVSNFRHLIYFSYIFLNESFINSPKLIIWSQFWNVWTHFFMHIPICKNLPRQRNYYTIFLCFGQRFWGTWFQCFCHFHTLHHTTTLFSSSIY